MKKSKHDSTPADKTKEIVNAIAELTEPVCRDHLDEEYLELTRLLTAKLARKRPSPLLKGKVEIWACAVVYALGQVNFLFDKTQTPHLKPKELCELFGVKPTTAQNKARIISEFFKMVPLDPRWYRPSQLDKNPLAWMGQTSDGCIIDIRDAPKDIQEEAFSDGLIPFIPDDHNKKEKKVKPLKDEPMDSSQTMLSLEKTSRRKTPYVPKNPLGKAQFKMYDAWEIDNPEEQISMAFDALKLSRDCADAWSLLAREASDTPMEALNLYTLAVSAGERAIDEKIFKEEVGNFWGILETRPYMRALAGIARLFFDMGELDQAAGIYNDLLRLNPGDNQGNRYLLAATLLENKNYADLKKLLGQYNEGTAFWAYSRAILSFVKRGNTKKSRESLQFAFKQNPYVPEYLLNLDDIPDEGPEFYSYGDRAEAIMYVETNYFGWEKIKGALKWLKKEVEMNKDILES